LGDPLFVLVHAEAVASPAVPQDAKPEVDAGARIPSAGSRWRDPPSCSLLAVTNSPTNQNPLQILEGNCESAVSVFVMHLRYSAFASTAIIALLVSCTNVPSSTPPVGAGSGPPTTAIGDGPERALQNGMTAEEVKHIMGTPAEIKPMESPTGKAEVWIYRRTMLGRVEQIQVGSKPITVSSVGGDGLAHLQTVAEEPIYKQAVHTDEETISLLMFDGRFISQKRTVEKRLNYQ
jgi:hypothetical protein